MQESKRRLRVSPSLIISIVALLLATSAGAYAVTVAPKNSVVSKSIKNGQVKGLDIARNAVNSKKIKDGQIGLNDLSAATVGSFYTKAQSDANYYTKVQSDANYFTKAQSDAKYAPSIKLLRGSFFAGGTSPAGSVLISGGAISFGVTFSAAPTPHYIPVGAPVPVGCLGDANNPDALPGHLCLFETLATNVTANRGTLDNSGGIGSTPFGAGVFGFSVAAGQAHMLGTWAARPISLVATASPVNPGAHSSGSGGLIP